MNKIWVCLLLVLSAVAVQADNKLHYNVISLQATAEREVVNDLMQVWLSIEHEHKQSSQAAANVNLDAQWALQQAKPYSAIKASTQNYSTHPRYDERRVVAWTVRQQLKLESENFEQMAELISLLQEKLQLKRMAFVPTLATRVATEDALTAEALAAFRSKAELVVTALRQSNYDIVDIQLGERQQLRPVMRQQAEMMSMSAYKSKEVAVEAGSSTLRVSASGRIQVH